ncbi:MAG: HAD hydrolase-like protein [Dongiaceae bacterium]
MTAVLLDLDGTLTDPKTGITGSIRYALETLELPVPTEAELLRFIGPPLRDSFDRLFGDPVLTQRCLALYRERFGTIGLYENRVFDGVPAVLDTLRAAGYRLVLATSKPHVFARRILEHFGLASRFNAVHGAELDGTRANKAELIAHILTTEGIVPQSAVMIGDRLHDMQGAAANGMKAIGALYGYGDEAELMGAGAALTIATPMEMPTAVKQLLPI